jgi:hypothetical protein
MNNFVRHKAGAPLEKRDPGPVGGEEGLSLTVVGSVVPNLVDEIAAEEAPDLL